MGVFIRNKTKRVQKTDEKAPVLVNTNPNVNKIGEENTVIEKKAIKSGFGDRKNNSTDVKKSVIDNLSITKKEEKKEIVPVQTEKIEHPAKLLLNKSNNLNEPLITEIKQDPVKIIIDGNKKHDNKKENDRYYNFIFNEGILNTENIKNINKKLDEYLKKDKINFSFIDLFYFKSFIKEKSIALVANSSDLLNKQNGQLIDSHDIVIRFNSYKLSEKHTGLKTTIHTSIYLQNENLNEYVPIRFIIANHPNNWSNKIKKLNKFKQGAFLKYNHHSIIQNFKEIHPSTSGFVALILLLKLGGYEKINLFGFNFYQGGVNSIFRTDGGMVLPISTVHDYDFEKNFLNEYSYEYSKSDNIFTFYDYSSF
jgi:hypothetical protein